MHRTADFDYELEPHQIAQEALDQRDASRLLVLDRETDSLAHRQFTDLIDYLRPGDVMVANDSRVIPARLYGRKVPSGGQVELLLLDELADTRWRVLAGGRRIREGTRIRLLDAAGTETDLVAEVMVEEEGPLRQIQFDEPLKPHLQELGQTPLPPYIHKPVADPERYQTVYARTPGSAAAPTAGLHFTGDLLLTLRRRGVLFETITLHVGLDTFKPVESEAVSEHDIHSEWARLSPETARRINEAKLAGGRIIAVGTTSVRVLETAALRSAGLSHSLSDISARDAEGETTSFCPWRPVTAFEGPTDLYIYPGYHYRAVDIMLTNFHLPQSTLIMLVAAFAGRRRVLDAYREAMALDYRFYSFGDAMLIL